MAKSKKPIKPALQDAKARDVKALAAALQREVAARLGPDATFEQRQDAAAAIMSQVLHQRADDDLQSMVTDDEEVEIDGRRFRRLVQSSSATYVGRWGPHLVFESLYRDTSVRNGPTVKPIELRAGIVERMTPDMARLVGELSAWQSSRELVRTLRTTGHTPPSRSFLERHTKALAQDIATDIENLEAAAREAELVAEEIGSVSCGMDRMAVRMTEPAVDSSARQRKRSDYQRSPPPPKEHNYRMAWVGSMTYYDLDGIELKTLRYGTEAGADPSILATRVARDVAAIVLQHPGIPVHCVQDGAPELKVLPAALVKALPSATAIVTLVDLQHLMGYLDRVVDATQPDGDPNDMKDWYRAELLRDDMAIDRILVNLRHMAGTLPGHGTAARKAVARAITYIRKRKPKMRYASHYARDLPIGSGATESTCWQMQQRVKRPGQSWEVPGLRGALTVRGVVLSDRWPAVWASYAEAYRGTVLRAA